MSLFSYRTGTTAVLAWARDHGSEVPCMYGMAWSIDRDLQERGFVIMLNFD